MPELTESQLYDLHNRGNGADNAIQKIEKAFVMHLRHEHGMRQSEISKRTGIAFQRVREILKEDLDG